MNMWRYVNIFVLNVFTQSTWGVFTCVHTSGAQTVTTVALMRLISFFPALLSCSLVSPAFILCVLLFTFGMKQMQVAWKKIIHRVNLIFSMLVNKKICSKQMRLVWSNVRIDFTWQVNRACIINSCPYVIGLPSTVLILWVLTRFFYDDRGYVFTVLSFIFLHFI